MRPEVAADFIARSRHAFNAATQSFVEHPAAVTLGKLHTRAARAIASSPLWLMAPDIPVELPFLNPEVVRAALQVPLETKVDGAYFKSMLFAADPHIAALPSTNDPRPPPNRKRIPRRQTRPESLKVLTGHIQSAEPVQELFTQAARSELLDPTIDDPVRGNTRKFRILTWASLLGHWIRQHQSHLSLDNIPI